MFKTKVSDLKWRVLAQIERGQYVLTSSEVIGPYEKHHHYEGETPFPRTTFCVATIYARKSLRGTFVPCAKNKATHLIVRPHLRWELPEDLTSDCSGLPWLHEKFELHVRRFFNAYAGSKPLAGNRLHFIGLETVMSARDISNSPSAPIDLWDRAVTSYLARSTTQTEEASAPTAAPLASSFPNHDATTSRWPSGVAFQRRPVRGAAYRWQGGVPNG